MCARLAAWHCPCVNQVQWCRPGCCQMQLASIDLCNMLLRLSRWLAVQLDGLGSTADVVFDNIQACSNTMIYPVSNFLLPVNSD